jgi:hypothetical protein
MTYTTTKTPTVLPPPVAPSKPPISAWDEDALADAMKEVARVESARTRLSLGGGSWDHTLQRKQVGAKGGKQRFKNRVTGNQVIGFLADGKARTSIEVAHALGITTKKASSRLGDLARAGRVERVGYANSRTSGARVMMWRVK